MSQASKVLKEIAAGAEYTALVQAVEKGDYSGIAQAYQQVTVIIQEKKKQILEKIDTLTRQNKDEDRQQFLNAFALRTSTVLPAYSRLESLMKEQKVTEGEVIGAGSKGDPMVRTADGKLTIISGLTAVKGARVTFRTTRDSEKVNFGQVVEFTPDFFYLLLNQPTLNGIRDLFNEVEARLRIKPGEMTPELLNELLQKLEKIRELAGGLRADEKEKTETRILTYRKRLLGEYGVKMALDFIEQREAEEITVLCQADNEKLSCALAAPGLFRYQTHQTLKSALFAGKQLKGYNERLAHLESNLDSMDAALKLMEFKSGFEEIEPQVREYLEKLDAMFEKLHRKARTVIYGMAEEKVASVEDIQKHIEEAFADKGACTEIRGIFRSPGEFFTQREALTKLRAMLGNTASQSGETAIRPYLNQKMNLAFAR